MPRQFSRRDQNGVETQILKFDCRIVGQPDFSGRGDAGALALGHRFRRVIQRCARLHFDEDHGMAPAGDDIDLTRCAAKSPR